MDQPSSIMAAGQRLACAICAWDASTSCPSCMSSCTAACMSRRTAGQTLPPSGLSQKPVIALLLVSPHGCYRANREAGADGSTGMRHIAPAFRLPMARVRMERASAVGQGVQRRQSPQPQSLPSLHFGRADGHSFLPEQAIGSYRSSLNKEVLSLV